MQIDLLQHPNMILGTEELLSTPSGLEMHRFAVSSPWYSATAFMQDCTSGVRLAFTTDAERIRLRMQLGRCIFEFGHGDVDILADGRLIYSGQPAGPWEDGQIFTVDAPLPGKAADIIVYLPTYRKSVIQSLELIKATQISPLPPASDKILLIGDSIVQGYGPTPAFCWAAQYARRTGRDFLNLGIGGACMPSTIPPQHLRKEFSEVILAFGTNDAHQVRSPEQITSSLQGMLDCLKNFSGRIIVSTPVPDLSNSGHPEQEKAWCRISEAIRQTVQGYPTVHLLDGNQLIPAENSFYADGIHPALNGATLLADAYCALHRKIVQ